VRPLKVEFAPPPRAAIWLWAATCVALGVIAMHQFWSGWQAYGRVQALQAEIARASEEQKLAQQRAQEAELARERDKPDAREVAAALRLMRFPLDQVLRALESTRITGVRVVNLDIDAAAGSVRVDLEFEADEALFEYLETINLGEPTPRWKLVTAKWREAGSSAPSTATIASQWNADGQ